MLEFGKYHIPEVGHYIKENGQPKLKVILSPDNEYEEVEISDDIRLMFDGSFIIGNVFEMKLNDTTKRDFIHNFFSNDDQIAIILNKNLGKDKELFSAMQGWRKWVSIKIEQIKNIKAKQC